jgi:hypothetical protein
MNRIGFAGPQRQKEDFPLLKEESLLGMFQEVENMLLFAIPAQLVRLKI